MFFTSAIGIVLQVVFGTVAAGLVIRGVGDWFPNQNHVALNANPFAYIFGPKGEKIIRALLLFFGASYIYGSMGAYVAFALHLIGVLYYWIYMILLYHRVTEYHANGRFFGTKPPSTTREPVKEKSKGVSLWA
jgi:hypothetical protein